LQHSETPPGPAGRRPDRVAPWWLYRCREDLIAEEDECRRAGTPQPSWAQSLLERIDHYSLVHASERIVADAVRLAGAISEAPPPIRLSRLAEWLHVSLRFFAEEESNRFRPSAEGPNAVRPRWIRGTIAPDGSNKWVLHAGTRSSTYTRETVAHELGHALLFHGENGIDLRSWRAATWTSAEETLVNYMARVMLAPAELVPEPESVGENLAEYIVAHIAATFQMPHRMAATRALDLREHVSPRLRAVVMWRQYHPFSAPFMDACFRSSLEARTRFRIAAHELRSAFPHASFDRALALWTEVLRARVDQDPWATLRLDPAEVAVTQRLAGSLALEPDPELEERLERLTQPHSRVFFRPEWLVWRGRPARSYVPEHRGSARAGSLVARLAGTSATAADISKELVQIGNLEGLFRVHAYAHGDPSEGARYVLTALEDTDAE
jgi:hypothetical protein